MGTRHSALHVDLFEQPGQCRVFQHTAKGSGRNSATDTVLHDIGRAERGPATYALRMPAVRLPDAALARPLSGLRNLEQLDGGRPDPGERLRARAERSA